MSTEGRVGPQGPYKLVTVNTVPERAKKIVGRLVEELKATYTINYVANSPTIEGVRAMVEEHKPDLLFTASMWTSEEAEQIITIARKVVPNVKTMSVPKGLQAEQGPDAVVDYAKTHLPEILAQLDSSRTSL